MKILLLIPGLIAGGAERVMVTLANEWSKTENVTIMVFDNGKSFYKVSKCVHIKALNNMPPKRGMRRKMVIPIIELKRYRAIYKEIKNGNYDFVLSFCFTTNVFACIAASFLKNENIIVSERNDPNRYGRLEAILIDKVYRNAKTIICQNRESKEYFENKKFKSRLIELPNPVNFADVPTERPEQVADEIVNVGRLIEQKNQRLLIEAFSEISEAYPNYTLKIYGEGPLKETLSNQIREKKLQDRVFLMGTKKRVMYEVNKASIFVLSSDFEGFPNVLIEAMATGMPVISSDFKTGVARELITSDRNGYLFEVGNKDELVKKIKMLINKKSDFLLMGEENRKVAMRYKDNVIAKEWLEELKAD